MEINNIGSQIKWQELSAREILKLRDDGQQVPTEIETWALAIAPLLDIQDEVTYEMSKGETDIEFLEAELGLNNDKKPEKNSKQKDNDKVIIPEEEFNNPEFLNSPDKIEKRKIQKGV